MIYDDTDLDDTETSAHVDACEEPHPDLFGGDGAALPVAAPEAGFPRGLDEALAGLPVETLSARARLVRSDAAAVLAALPDASVHAIVTDPPYGATEYEPEQLAKLRGGRGGIWRIPPAFDGVQRSPLPRFTVFTADELDRMRAFFAALARDMLRVLTPGGHVFLASNPLVSTQTFQALMSAGFEKRGEVIRLVQTLRGGDRPKGAHEEFDGVTVMPRSAWEPWGLFRKPCDGTVANTLRRHGTGALRRISDAEPFRDVIACSPTRGKERALAPHPSLKPQRFLRQIVRASLPLGRGVVLDPFAGSGSTLAAAEAVGYASVGVERDATYADLAVSAFPALARLIT